MGKNIIFALLSYFTFAVSALNACQCVAIDPSDIPSDKRAVQETEVSNTELFVGKVIDVEILYIPTGQSNSFHSVRVAQLIVDRLWFGKHQWRKTVYTERFGAGCGIDFKVGDRYLIQDTDDDELARLISKIDKDAILTNRCTSTLFDLKKEATVMEEFDKMWKPWVPNIQLDQR